MSRFYVGSIQVSHLCVGLFAPKSSFDVHCISSASMFNNLRLWDPYLHASVLVLHVILKGCGLWRVVCVLVSVLLFLEFDSIVLTSSWSNFGRCLCMTIDA
jgi:hypothetical protein